MLLLSAGPDRRVLTARVDAGLRATACASTIYKSIGLAITGLAELGVYMGPVTAVSRTAAAKIGKAFLTLSVTRCMSAR